MKADDIAPIRVAELLRNLTLARQQHHPVARDVDAAGTLPPTTAALWFDHIINANERPPSAPVSDQSPALRHYAYSLQATRRRLRQSPEDTPSLNRLIREREGHIRRRMKTVKPTTGRLQP